MTPAAERRQLTGGREKWQLVFVRLSVVTTYSALYAPRFVVSIDFVGAKRGRIMRTHILSVNYFVIVCNYPPLLNDTHVVSVCRLLP